MKDKVKRARTSVLIKSIAVIFLLHPGHVLSQSVLFDKSFYSTNEDVTGTLLAKADGIENSIKPNSMGATDGHFNLTSNRSPGYYPVKFRFGANSETYCVLILPSDVSAGKNPPKIVAVNPADSRYNVLLDKIMQYSKEKGSFTAILNRVAKKYMEQYPVQGPVTLVACIGVPASGGNPIFIFTCKQGLEAMAKDLGIFVLESLNEELFLRKKISKEDYDFFKGNIALIQYAINAYTAEGVVDSFTTIANATDTDTGKHLAYTVSISDQVFKKYQFIMKFQP